MFKIARGWITYNRHVLAIAKKHPELQKSKSTNPGNGEETDPLDAGGDTETKTSHGEPEPPTELECLDRSLFMLVGEARKCHGGKGSGSNEGRIEQDKTSLG